MSNSSNNKIDYLGIAVFLAVALIAGYIVFHSVNEFNAFADQLYF